jgi:hypothetical protein
VELFHKLSQTGALFHADVSFGFIADTGDGDESGAEKRYN